MEKGLSFEAFAGLIKVSKQTLYTWCEKHAEFKEAKEIGEGLAHLWWERTGIEGLFMGGKDNPFNATVWVFSMKNRFGWRDKPKDEDEGDAPKASGIAMSASELLDLVKKAREGK